MDIHKSIFGYPTISLSFGLMDIQNTIYESYYNLSNVCLFVCLFVCSHTPPRSLGRSSPNLEGRWRAAPDISLRGSFFERSRSSRSKVKFVFFSVCSPTSPRSLSRSSPNLVGRLRATPDISSRGSFIKGQGHRGQRSNFCISQVLGLNFTKLRGMVEGGPGYWLEGFIF